MSDEKPGQMIKPSTGCTPYWFELDTKLHAELINHNLGTEARLQVVLAANERDLVGYSNHCNPSGRSSLTLSLCKAESKWQPLERKGE